MSEEKKLNGTVIVTYRCNARCSMCNRYKAPSKPEEEISIETIKKLPKMYFTNITGGEPFIRTDLNRGWKMSDRVCQHGVHEFYRGCLSVPEKPVKITEKFTEVRLINGWLYGNMKI